LWLAALLTLGGCAAPGNYRDAGALRDPAAPFGGTTRFEAARFAGVWRTIGCIGDCATAERYVVATDDVFVRIADGADTPYVVAAPGVLREMGSDRRLVVMWVDEGFRTAAIGAADGSWAAVIDRGRGAPDRVTAAREILDFNGWDVGQLREVSG
jgi:apolipoprotein D and lipocalin family protein